MNLINLFNVDSVVVILLSYFTIDETIRLLYTLYFGKYKPDYINLLDKEIIKIKNNYSSKIARWYYNERQSKYLTKWLLGKNNQFYYSLYGTLNTENDRHWHRTLSLILIENNIEVSEVEITINTAHFPNKIRKRLAAQPLARFELANSSSMIYYNLDYYRIRKIIKSYINCGYRLPSFDNIHYSLSGFFRSRPRQIDSFDNY